jgi:hypothetical protein
MRLRLFLLAALVAAGPAWAASPPSAPEAATKPNTRMTMEQRFERANTAQDGRLTLEQAKRGYKTIARNFARIDTTGKGFVTIEDIRAWRQANREARQAARAAMNDPLRPRHAVQRAPGDQAAQSVPPPSETPPSIAPLVAVPLAVVPLAVAPLAVAPLAVAPLAVAPLAVAPLALTPPALTPPPVTPPAVTPPAADPVAETPPAMPPPGDPASSAVMAQGEP